MIWEQLEHAFYTLQLMLKNGIQMLIIRSWEMGEQWTELGSYKNIEVSWYSIKLQRSFFSKHKNTSLDKVIIFAISNTLKVHPFNNEIQCSVFDTYVHSVFHISVKFEISIKYPRININFSVLSYLPAKKMMSGYVIHISVKFEVSIKYPKINIKYQILNDIIILNIKVR